MYLLGEKFAGEMEKRDSRLETPCEGAGGLLAGSWPHSKQAIRIYLPNTVLVGLQASGEIRMRLEALQEGARPY